MHITEAYHLSFKVYEEAGKEKEWHTHIRGTAMNVEKYFYSGDAMVVAYLHDCIEDGLLVREEIRATTKEQYDALFAISKQPSMSYNEYITGVTNNPLATKVKLCDAMQNYERCLIDGDYKRAVKYSNVINILTDTLAKKEY